MDCAVALFILIFREQFLYWLAAFEEFLQAAFRFIFCVFVRLVEPKARAWKIGDYIAKRKLGACSLRALNGGDNRDEADFRVYDSLHNFANPRRIFAPERSWKRRIRNAFYVVFAPTPRLAAVGGCPSVFENIPKKLHFVSSQPQNCDSLKTISELNPIARNSASLSATVLGYIQPRRAFALLMICSDEKPFFAFISQ